MPKSIRILLIDDHRALTDAMSLLIGQQESMEVVGVANTFEDGMELIQSQQCDIAIIDMNLGKSDSCELIFKSKESGQIPIVLSAYSDLSIVKRALRAGTKAYISKSSAADSVVAGVFSVLKGETYFDQVITQEMSNFLTQDGSSSNVNERVMISDLTSRERDVIRLIALEYTSDEIAKELFLAKNTVDSYRKNLIQKLQVKNAVGLGVYAIKHNLL